MGQLIRAKQAMQRFGKPVPGPVQPLGKPKPGPFDDIDAYKGWNPYAPKDEPEQLGPGIRAPSMWERPFFTEYPDNTPPPPDFRVFQEPYAGLSPRELPWPRLEDEPWWLRFFSPMRAAASPPKYY